MVARRAHNPEVAGSSPVSATKKILFSLRKQDFSFYILISPKIFVLPLSKSKTRGLFGGLLPKLSI